MNRPPTSSSRPATLLVEPLEQRIAPAGLLNESKFTSVVVGSSILLDASGGTNDFQGLTTGAGAASGSYLLYVTEGKALVFTTDLNGNGRLDPGEITGISASVDSQGRPLNLTLFSDIHGDIVTNLLAGHGVDNLTDSDNNPNNGRDGQILNDVGITSITLRTLTDSDIDPNIPGNTVANRLALTSFSIYGNIVTGGDFGGLSLDKSGDVRLIGKFNGTTGTQLYRDSVPSIGGIFTGTAADNMSFHFQQNSPFTQVNGTNLGNNVEGHLVPFQVPVGEHGGDISNISATQRTTAFSVGVLATGAGGFNARGGDISNVTYNGVSGSYSIIAGDGGQGASGGMGGSVLQFSDVNSTTGQVTIHTGTGGVGLLGTGGLGGMATFATTNVAAHVSVFLGNGGQGFTKGGDGAGLPTARFTAPEGAVPSGSEFVGTWHQTGDLGNTTPVANTGTNAAPNYTFSPDAIDWDGDGIGDGVYAGLNPDQVVVVFGDGGGGFDSSKSIVLNTPGVTNPTMTVGDFNGDGRPDIAVASGNVNNFGGVYVYLNQIQHPTDALPNPRNTTDFTGNPNGDHPFSEALQTAFPSLVQLGLFQGPSAVAALAAGDFNGDGLTDLAYVQQATLIFPPTNPIRTVIGVLFGDPASDPTTGQTLVNATTGHLQGTGYFFANSANPTAAPTLQATVFLGDPINGSILHATSLAVGNVAIGSTNGLPNAPEVFFYGRGGGSDSADPDDPNNGAGAIVPLAVGVDAATHKPTAAGLVINSPTGKAYGLGQVDTNRTVSSGSARQVTLQNVTLQDFTLQDLDSNGLVDIIAVSKTPATYLVTLQQTMPGTFVIGSNNPNADQVDPSSITYKDNNGIFLGTPPNPAPPQNDIASVDVDGDGHFDQIAALGQTATIAVREFTLAPTTGMGTASTIFYSGGRPTLIDTFAGGTTGAADITAAGGFDPIYSTVPSAATPFPTTDYGVLAQNSTNYQVAALNYLQGGFGYTLNGFLYLTSNGFYIDSGAGGSSTTGPGGSGGKLGNTLGAGANGDALGSLSVLFPGYAAYRGQAVLFGGSGGNGFAGGGIGGDISGVSVRYAPTARVLTSGASLLSGVGGNGISGDGGRGGNLSEFSVLSGTLGQFFTGDGGSGLHGGAGGSILGNTAGFFDNSGVSTQAIAGNGGQGALGGGQGGSVTNFDAVFLPVIGGAGGSLFYTSGNGGTAAGGGGGAGGDINGSSPDVNTNNLGGSLTLFTGQGGNGLSGGRGGNITTFVNQTTDSIAIASILSVTTGNGGIGVANVGGSGGNITGFSSNATGLTPTIDGSLAGLARVIAGDGGVSIGGTGGAGGSITSITAQATSTPIIVAAGAGGSGLNAGGLGGSVTSSIINSAAQLIGKVLIVAGAGGDTRAALPSDVVINGDSDTTDLAHQILAYGGVSGLGGNGGSISDIRQPVSTQTAVDLIAGNGGSTLNYGNALSTTTNVGMGGSIQRVTLAGTLGTISRDTSLGAVTNPPIKSYSAPDPVTGLTTTSVTAIVDYIANGGAFVLNDAAGNVGAVAGVAGQVKAVNGAPQPARDGINGSVVTLTASSIMSIVAGSVDSVAPVQVLSGITVTNRDGVLGADKSANAPYGPNGVLDYFNPVTGQIVQNLDAGYKLIDGALFATTIIQPVQAPFITGPRVF